MCGWKFRSYSYVLQAGNRSIWQGVPYPTYAGRSSDSPISPSGPPTDQTASHSVCVHQPAGPELLKHGAGVQSPSLGAPRGLQGEASAEAASVQQRGLHGVPEKVLQVHRTPGEISSSAVSHKVGVFVNKIGVTCRDSRDCHDHLCHLKMSDRI